MTLYIQEMTRAPNSINNPNYIISKPPKGNEICKEKGKIHCMQGIFTTFKSYISYGKL